MDDISESIPTQSNEANSGSSTSSVFGTRLKTKIEYRVKHGYFKWTIGKFSDFPPRKNNYYISPDFELQETSWYMALHPKAKSFGINKIALNLFRSPSDDGPRTVGASYRMGLENTGNKLWFKTKERKIFGKGDSYGFETSILGHLEDFMADSDDTISVLCEMYVQYALNVNNTISDDNEVDIQLPKDLLAMFRHQQHSDILIEISNVHLRAHKSVLCARSKTLARMLEDGTSFLQFKCTRSCLYCAFFYMYTGNFNFLGRYAVFSIGLYEFARELSLSKLRDIAIPKNIELKSRIVIKDWKIECRFPGFQLCNLFEKNGETGAFWDEGVGMGVNIYFQKAENAPDSVECRVELSGVAGAMDFNFRLLLQNKNHEPPEFIPAVIQGSSIEIRNSLFCFTSTFTVDDVLRCLSDGTLCLIFMVARYSVENLSDPTEDVGTETSFCYDLSIWQQDLSSDFIKLLTSRKLSDIILVCMGERFQVHRSILLARSGYFRKVIQYKRSSVEIVNISNSNPFTLELMLTYIYSGSLGDTDDLTNEDFLELYEAAEDYEIKSLAKECEDFLLVNLDREFVYDILIVAKKYNNMYLQSLCETYISFLDVDSDTTDSADESMDVFVD